MTERACLLLRLTQHECNQTATVLVQIFRLFTAGKDVIDNIIDALVQLS